jgi:pimeloyl-ACP methyl ester carboxylesterase
LSSSATNTTAVLYVHGLWLPGHEGFLLLRRLGRELRAETHSFTYSSVGMGITDNALALQRRLKDIRADTVHVVAHSLGGLVVLKLFELAAGGGADASVRVPQALPPGRVVLLGSPVQGSQSAQRLARARMGRRLMGRAAEALLEPGGRRWRGGRDLGVIAGDMPVGIGRLLGPMGAPNDGTVLVQETTLPGATQHLLLRVSHSGMPYSARVARQTAAFFREGRFEG